MPFGDQTGPAGLGPGSGRGFGYCAGYTWPGYAFGPGFGGGRGRGFGRGFGWRIGFRPGFGAFRSGYPVAEAMGYTPEQEKDFLNSQIASMEKTIENLKTRLSDIEQKE